LSWQGLNYFHSQNHVYDEHSHSLQIYWSDKDVITWLVENSDDEHLKKVKQHAEQHAVKMEVTSRSVHDEKALFDEDDDVDGDDDEIVLGRESTPVVAPPALETSKQKLYSIARHQPQFEGLRITSAGHRIQEIRELMTVPVCAMALLSC
jgi:protein SSD1